MTRIIMAVVVTATLSGAALAQPNAKTESDIKQLLTALIEAQRTFDAAKLDALFAPDYIEISPVGEVDPRAKVLGFYAPDKKVPDVPLAALDEVSTRVDGTTAITIARITYQMKGPNGATTSRSMRCVFVTRTIAGQWKLASAQFTPIRN